MEGFERSRQICDHLLNAFTPSFPPRLTGLIKAVRRSKSWRQYSPPKFVAATAARTKIAVTIMAGASDKARFYLEQSVPELQEFERKKVFTKVSVLLCLITISRANFKSRKKSVQ